MTTKLNLTRDINGFNAFGLNFTDTAYSCTLTASSNTTLTVPKVSSIGGASYEGTAQPQWLAVFAYDPGTSVWVSDSATVAASNPAGNTFAATISELNPAARKVQGGDVLNFFTTGTGVNVWVGFWWIGQ